VQVDPETTVFVNEAWPEIALGVFPHFFGIAQAVDAVKIVAVKRCGQRSAIGG
jgi:hypothetical protein